MRKNFSAVSLLAVTVIILLCHRGSAAGTCWGGKEWQECASACPLTCDNYDRAPVHCALPCMEGCVCPEGKVELDGVCVEPSTYYAVCSQCKAGQQCSAVMSQSDHAIVFCKDPIAVPCLANVSLTCPTDSRCLTHSTTGTSFCLQSCFMQNGGCSEDQTCYSQQTDENCNPLLESCFTPSCSDTTTDDQDVCPVGMVLNPCGSLCQRTCEDYLTNTRLDCPDMCALPDCVCPQGMVLFKDQCVDPLECYSLIHYAVVGLEKTLYYVREDNPEGVVEVCVIVYKTNNKDCPISFPFDVRISTVEDSEDYHTLSTVMAIGACETGHCVEVTIVNDEELEKTESFTVTLERTPDLDSRIILASVNADIEIIDDEMHGFAKASYDVREGETVDVTFEMKGLTSSENLTIEGKVIAEANTAQITDFELTQPIEIVNESTNITIVTINDIAVEIKEAFILRFKPQTFSSIQHFEEAGEFIRDSALVNIIENDLAVVSLERTFYSVSEDVDVVEVCALVSSPRVECPIEFPFEISISSGDNTAVSPMDYETLSTTLMFAACETQRCVNVTIVDDFVVEPCEMFAITLERIAGLNSRISLSSIATTIEIINDDEPQLCYTAPNCRGPSFSVGSAKECCVGTEESLSYSVGGTCTVPRCVVHGFVSTSYDVVEAERLDTTFRLNVKGRTTIPALRILGTITSEAGTARTSEFETLYPIDVENSADIRLITYDDFITLEYEDTVILRFTPGSPAYIQTLEQSGEFIRDSATVNIIDDDRLEILFKEYQYFIREGGTTTPQIRLQFRKTQNPFTVTFYPVSNITANGFNIISTGFNAATEDEDFFNDPFTITISATEQNPGGTSIYAIPANLHTVFDDNVNEVDQNFALLAELGDDVPDNFICFRRYFGDSECHGRRGAVDITIVDNDPMIIGFSQRGQTIFESDIPHYDYGRNVYIGVHSLRLSELDYELWFRALENGNATVHSYLSQYGVYDALFGYSSKELIYALSAGIMELNIITFVANDLVPEDPLKCYTISLFPVLSLYEGQFNFFSCNEDDANPTDYFCLHTICIEDDDEPFEVAFVKTTYTIIESEGHVEVCVNLTYPPLDILDETVHVEVINDENSVYIPPGAALATPDSFDFFLGMYPMAVRSDYEEQIRGINGIRDTVINYTRRIVCYNQPIYNDLRLEVSEYAGLTLTVWDSSVPTLVQTPYNNTAILIIDDDSAVVGLDRTIYQVTEGDVVEVCATVRSPSIFCPIQFSFDVRLSTVDMTAVSPSDFGARSNILRFDACDTRRCLSVTTVDDSVSESTEYFSLTLERTPGLDSRITLSPANGNIFIY